jgi:c-di-GMP-binding flagellar brake protein YcgR
VKLPHLNERIFVLPGHRGGRLNSRVEGSSNGDTITVAPPSEDGVVVALPVGEPVTVEWTTERGLFRGDGIVTYIASNDRPALTIRFDETHIAQRREHVRVDMVVEAEVKQTAGIAVRCVTLDLSGGGMRARIPLDLVAGEPLDGTVFLPDEAPIEFEAEVIRGSEMTGYAVRWTHMEPKDRERLIRHVFAAHRREFAALRRSA